MINGTEHIIANIFDEKTKYYQMVKPEEKIRTDAKQMPNVYFLVLFAACREARENLLGQATHSKEVEEKRRVGVYQAQREESKEAPKSNQT